MGTDMGLSIAVFVPEGIVIGSDRQTVVNNSDDGFVQEKQTSLFSFADKYLICITENGFAKGIPYGFYIEQAIRLLSGKKFETTFEFVIAFEEKIRFLLGKEEHISYYVAGIDYSNENAFEQFVYLIDKRQVNLINSGIDNSHVYNYHTIGNSIWIDKLILPTSFSINEKDVINFEAARIDFSKYSIDNAIDFVKFLLYSSYKMDVLSQIRPRSGNEFSIGVLPLNSNVYIL